MATITLRDIDPMTIARDPRPRLSPFWPTGRHFRRHPEIQYQGQATNPRQTPLSLLRGILRDPEEN